MTAEIANTTVTVLRGTTTDAFGDTIDEALPVATSIPVFLAETGKTVQDPSAATPRTIRQVTAQVPGWAGVLNTDRLLDERTQDIYIVLSVTQPPSLFGRRDDWNQVLSLKRVSAAGT